MEELKARIEELEKENQNLKILLDRKNNGTASAYKQIRDMIVQKIAQEVPIDIVNGIEKFWTRKDAERRLMDDLKWDIRVRKVTDFKLEHIESAREYIENYVIDDYYKKSKWEKE